MALIDNLIAYWKLDEASNPDTLADAHGTNTLNESGAASSVTGKLGTAMRVNGDYFAPASNTPFAVQSFSVSFWLQIDAPATDFQCPGMSYTDYSWTGNGWGFYTESGRLKFWVGNYTTSPAVGPVLSAGTWYHVVGTFDGATGELNLYLDGKLVASEMRAITISYASSTVLVGHAQSGTPFVGVQDETAFWSRALTESEVARLCNFGYGLAYPLSASVELEGFRFRNDDGSETAATWRAAQDTGAAAAKSTIVRLRQTVNATGDAAPTPYRLEYKLKNSSAPWRRVV